MHPRYWTLAVGLTLAAVTSVDGQIIGGVLSVTQSHMS